MSKKEKHVGTVQYSTVQYSTVRTSRRTFASLAFVPRMRTTMGFVTSSRKQKRKEIKMGEKTYVRKSKYKKGNGQNVMSKEQSKKEGR